MSPPAICCGTAPRHHLAAEPRDAHLRALEIGDRIDLLAPPSAHLDAGIAGGKRDDAEIVQERPDELEAAAVVNPSVLLALVEPEWQRGVEREGLVLADEVIARRMRALDRPLLNRVDDPEGRDNLPRREHADLELAAGELLDALGDHFPAPVDGVEALREARCATPTKGGQRRRL